MRTLTVTIIGILVTLTAAAYVNAAGGAPDPQISRLKAQVRTLNATISDQQDAINAQDDQLNTQTTTITRLRTRLANQPDPLDVITSRDPDGLWQAMRAIWLAMPPLAEGQLCGYDKNYTPGAGDGLTLTSYSFYRVSGC